MTAGVGRGRGAIGGASTFALAALLAAGLPAAPAGAQEQGAMGRNQATAGEKSHQPPAILVIYREEVKPGRTSSHNQLEANFARAYARMEGRAPFLAMTSLSGADEAWFLQGFGSMEEVEAESKAFEKAPAATRGILNQEVNELTARRTISTVFRKDLSYNAGVDLPKMRYMEVVTYHVRPGCDEQFMQAAELVKSGYEKAGIPMQWAVFQVFSGAPNGTYFVFRPSDSLAKMDPTDQTRMQKFMTALGDDGMKKLSKLESEGIVSSETNFFVFDPRMSTVSEEFAAVDSFWAQPGQMAQVGTSGRTPAVKKTVKKEKEKEKEKEKDKK